MQLARYAAVVLVCSLGCASQRKAEPSKAPSSDDACANCTSHVAAPAPSSPALADDSMRAGGSRRLWEEAPAVSDRWRTRSIGGGPASSSGRARPRRSKRVDIDLVKAPFDEVARLLGDTGGFNVVVEAPTTPVTVRLRDVDPYDALVVIAEARGIDVSYRSGIVIVGKTETKTETR